MSRLRILRKCSGFLGIHAECLWRIKGIKDISSKMGILILANGKYLLDLTVWWLWISWCEIKICSIFWAQIFQFARKIFGKSIDHDHITLTSLTHTHVVDPQKRTTWSDKFRWETCTVAQEWKNDVDGLRIFRVPINHFFTVIL